MATPQHKNFCPRGYEIYNDGRPFRCHHYFILNFLIYAWEREQDFERNNAFSIIELYDLNTGTYTQTVMNFTILIDPSLVISTMHFICLNHAPEQEKKIYLKK